MLGKESVALEEHTIVAKHVVKDINQLYGSISNVPITRDLLMTARDAYSEYMTFLEDQKRIETLAKQNQLEQERLTDERKNIERKKDEICQKLSVENRLVKDLAKEQETAKELINEASINLSSAVKDNNMTSAKVALMMLSSDKASCKKCRRRLRLYEKKLKI